VRSTPSNFCNPLHSAFDVQYPRGLPGPDEPWPDMATALDIGPELFAPGSARRSNPWLNCCLPSSRAVPRSPVYHTDNLPLTACNPVQSANGSAPRGIRASLAKAGLCNPLHCEAWGRGSGGVARPPCHGLQADCPISILSPRGAARCADVQLSPG
jgi:hypothetical protein